MDLQFTEEQQTFADTVRKLLARQPGPQDVDRTEDGTWDRELWAELADVGVLALTVPEDHGGLGLGPREVAAVMIEAGRALARQPYVDAALLPAFLLSTLGTEAQQADLLPDLVSGEVLYAVAHLPRLGTWASPVDATARTVAGQTILTGVKDPVLTGDKADRLLVSAITEDGGVGLFVVDSNQPGVVIDKRLAPDGTGAASVVLDGAVGDRLGTGDATTAIRDAVPLAQLAVCAEAVGAMQQVLDLTVDYLKTRSQFGQPLGKFQSLSHRAADLYVAVQTARPLTLFASARFAEGDTDPLLAARAKLQVGRSARLVGQEAIQMHGAIGMTTEHPVGHYVTRLLAIEHTFGSTDDQLRLLAAATPGYDHVEL